MQEGRLVLDVLESEARDSSHLIATRNQLLKILRDQNSEAVLQILVKRFKSSNDTKNNLLDTSITERDKRRDTLNAQSMATARQVDIKSILEEAGYENTSPGAINNLVRELKNADLIKLENNGSVSMTEYGYLVVTRALRLLDFFAEHRPYIMTHSFTDPSAPNLEEINFRSLYTARLVPSSDAFIAFQEIYKDILENANEKFYAIKPLATYAMTEAAIKKIEKLLESRKTGINKAFDFKYIALQSAWKETSIPKDRQTLLEKLTSYENEGLISRKMLSRISVALICSEKSAAISFPTVRNGSADLNYIFHSDRKEAIQYCERYFWAKWNEGLLWS